MLGGQHTRAGGCARALPVSAPRATETDAAAMPAADAHDAPPRGKVVIVFGVASLCLAYAVAAFWYGDVRYSLPTPRPPDLVEPPVGGLLPVDEWIAGAGVRRDGRPVLLHFFNPDCPCTRFNAAHLGTLRARFGDLVRFVGVAEAPAGLDVREAVAELELGIPVVVDDDGRIAARAGVYSTPQAVLVGSGGELVYRGNYNASRYCTDPRTEYVRIALEALARDASEHAPRGTLPYGCSLPENR